MNISMEKAFGSAALLASLLTPGMCLGALIDRGGGLIYDTDRNITWLADANYAQTSGYDADGRMPWQQAVDWAANLAYYDSVRGITLDDWRLPTTPQPDPSCGSQAGGESLGTNCTGSEMGHLFYIELGGVAPDSINTTHNSNYTLFSNIQSAHYWSGTDTHMHTNPYDADAWYFNMGSGNTNIDLQAIGMYAWAVRDGDVGAVPVPAAFWLFGSGLFAIAGIVRRKTTVSAR